MQLPQTIQCASCRYSVNHPIDACPICSEQFYWLVVPKYSLSDPDIRDYCARMNQLTEGQITDEFLTHGGHLWLPHNFWACDPSGVSLKTLSWVVEVKYFQHTSTGAEKKEEPEPAVWDTQPDQESPFYDGNEERLVVDDLDDTLGEDDTFTPPDAAGQSVGNQASHDDLSATQTLATRPEPEDQGGHRNIRDTIPTPTRLAHDKPEPGDTVPAGFGMKTLDANRHPPTRQPDRAASGERDAASPESTAIRKRRRTGAPEPATADRSSSMPVAPVAIFLFLMFLAMAYFVLRYHKNQSAQPIAAQTEESDHEPAVLP